jgi:hypothetical protein
VTRRVFSHAITPIDDENHRKRMAGRTDPYRATELPWFFQYPPLRRPSRSFEWITTARIWIDERRQSEMFRRMSVAR